ncbi:MAG: phosphoenolpyruvate carboxykinase (GTP) [Actinobacteria bacterium]|nr:phosphoenolpyruvate carboxykinase (GTP) [Actinomycetota bacterium]
MKTDHKKLLKWVLDMSKMCNPDRIIWIDGSEKQRKQLENEAVRTGELIRLNQKLLPGCVYHRTALNDVARTEHLTFICTGNRDDAGPNNNWMPPAEAYGKAGAIFKNSMAGRTMYVIPFSMGPVNSKFSKIGVELTDSIYVVLNMHIMTKTGDSVLDFLGQRGEFTKCLHSKADRDINKRLILHFPADNTIWSVGSGYGGNVLLGKKCLSLRIASYLGRFEGWLAEHMLIIGIEDRKGNITYITGAFPSACGKTNLAMLIPPDSLKKKGYKVWTVGDDIAWMRVKNDGSLWAINPETGFFGVLPGTNSKTNPNAIKTIMKNTIYTNVLLKDDGTVWWEGGDGPAPQSGIDWTGKPWQPGLKDEDGNPVKGANPNSRFTAPIRQCPCASPHQDDPEGVPISAIIFGGRRASLAPLVYQSFNWQHGVFVGSIMASEITAAQYGAQGKVRRDPMAMLPFCGYNMADYFRHWLDMGKKIVNQPKIFNVNWFRTGKDGSFLWPGYGENLRVLEWIIERCRDNASAEQTPVGYIPRMEDLDIDGLDISKEQVKELLKVDNSEWLKETEEIRQFYQQFGSRLPEELSGELESFAERLKPAK